MFFADDLLFVEASTNQMRVILDCLQRFGVYSGQKLNDAKSSICFSHNVGSIVCDDICALSEMQKVDDLGTYSGVPLIDGRLTKEIFEPLLMRMDAHLASWKMKMLSFAGRVTLAKSILMALPNHLMRTFYMPRLVCDEYDKKVRNFIWRDQCGE